ncbi:MAG: hypothetical protein QM661_00395 [Solimonas sp.]
MVAAAAAQAQQASSQNPPPNGPSQNGGQPPEPPAEAFTACAGHHVGDKVSVSDRNHTIDGTCEKFGDRLALRPSRPPNGNGGPPPGQGGNDSGGGKDSP